MSNVPVTVTISTLIKRTEEDHYKHGYDQCEKDNSYNKTNWDVSDLPSIPYVTSNSDIIQSCKKKWGHQHKSKCYKEEKTCKDKDDQCKWTTVSRILLRFQALTASTSRQEGLQEVATPEGGVR